MAERGGRYYAVRAEPQAYSTQAIQELRIQQLEQEIAVLKQRNADLTMCLDEAVAHIHRLSPRISARIVAEIDKLKPRGKPPQPYVQEEIPFLSPYGR
jgi:hypothetical protein